MIKMSGMKRSLIIASFLFFLDAFVLNQGFIAFVILFVVVPVMLKKAISARKDKALLKKQLLNAGIYSIAAIMVLASNSINNTIAQRNADKIIQACEQYKAKHGIYPERLSELIPDFLKDIPPAKYSLAGAPFRYFAREDSHALMYEAVPPYGRKYYVFEKRVWQYVD